MRRRISAFSYVARNAEISTVVFDLPKSLKLRPIRVHADLQLLGLSVLTINTSSLGYRISALAAISICFNIMQS